MTGQDMIDIIKRHKLEDKELWTISNPGYEIAFHIHSELINSVHHFTEVVINLFTGEAYEHTDAVEWHGDKKE